ncbi:MAG TPA: AI-2E family transporter [Caulobacteraceae bacterium]|jgi:predicted PurR-regulated permease PerM
MAGESGERRGVLSPVEFLHRVLITFAIIVVAYLFWRWLDVFLLAFGAALIALILRTASEPVDRYTPLNAGWSLAVAGLVLAAVVGGTLWLFGSTIAGQLNQLAAAVPAAWEAAKPQIAGWPLGPQFLQTVSDFTANAPAPADAKGVGGGLSEGVITQLREMVVRLGGLARSALSVAAEIFVVVVAGAYFAAEPRTYRDGLVMLLPPRVRPEARGALDEAASALRRWLLGTLFSMFVVGTLTGLGAWAIGLPAPLALGLIAGLAQFVPIIGPAVSTIPGLLISLSLGPQVILWTLLLYVGVQQFEGQLLTPLVQRRTVHIPPAVTLLAVIAVGLIFGPLGVLFASPLTVVAYVMVRRLYVHDVLGDEVEDVRAAEAEQRPAGG